MAQRTIDLPTDIKPHMWFGETIKMWQCADDVAFGMGLNPKQAYQSWISNSIELTGKHPGFYCV